MYLNFNENNYLKITQIKSNTLKFQKKSKNYYLSQKSKLLILKESLPYI